MWEIVMTVPDPKSPITYESLLMLKADKVITDQTRGAISWVGKVNGIDVEIIQPSILSYEIDEFEFMVFPRQYEYLKYAVVTAIANYVLNES